MVASYKTRTILFGSSDGREIPPLRSEEAFVRIVDDPYISPIHFALTLNEADIFYARDMGSTNGTWVIRSNSVPIRLPLGETVMLRWADQIMIGRTLLPWRIDR